MWKYATVLALVALVLSAAPAGDTPGDPEREAVEAAVADYVLALYDVDPARIERSVHRGLEKLGCWRPPEADAYRTPSKMTYDQLFELAGNWNADDQQGDDLTYEIEVFDVLDKTASAKLSAKWGIDYMHLMKYDGKWKINQVLWQSHPPEKKVGSAR